MTRRTRRMFLFSGCVLLLVATALLYLDLTKPVIKSKADLVFVHGPFRDYKWTGTGKNDYFIFRLQNYSNNFRINLRFVPILKSDDFVHILPGEDITIGIPKSYFKYLNTDKSLFFVYSIASSKEIFLDDKEAIKKYNSIFFKVFSGILLLLAFGFIYGAYKKAKISN